jgi:hypothetical protein
MPKYFELDQKQLFTAEFHDPISASEPCPKYFGIPKMKLDFQNIDWEFRSFGNYKGKQEHVLFTT